MWFQGWDLVFDFVGLIVALLIAGYSWRLYKVNGQNKFAYFAFAFVLIAIGLLSKVFTDSVIYFKPIRDVTAVVLAPVAGKGLSLSQLYYRSGFFIQMVSMLGAWLLIFFISQKSRQRLRRFHEISQIGLFVYLVLLVSVVSNFNAAVFYLTSSVLLGIIVLNYYKNYLNTNRNKNAFNVMVAFMFILVGNLFLVFVFLQEALYVVGEFFMLVGFLLILQTYHKVTHT
ncbi:TPA: hypothetical protein HA278_00235 [Candidatus Woesearchaeota archaeon]|nr:hypothetical protein [archaeon]HIJ10456.1 hypothetical protein [Candidatus Woesearchaeota archaeon]